jgi:hypothetical protein
VGYANDEAIVKKPSTLPKRAQVDPLIALDDPGELDLDVVIEERAPDTARPNYEPDAFAKHVETEGERMTQPPSPTYDMLRDSCKQNVAADVALDEEKILRPSSAKIKTTRKT